MCVVCMPVRVCVIVCIQASFIKYDGTLCLLV